VVKVFCCRRKVKAKYFSWTQLCSCAFVFLGLCMVTPAAAATDDNQRFHEEQLRRQQQIESEREKRFEQNPDAIGPAAPTKPKEEVGEEKPCFVVREIQFELVQGSRAPASWTNEFSWIDPTSQHAVGKCLGVQGLNRVIQELTEEAIQRGRTTTRFTFPPQDFSQGILHIGIAPGIISAIRFSDPESGGSWKTALPLRPGDFLDLRAIEQAVEQFGRLPSLDATFDLLPGAGVGESEILIKRKRSKPWRTSLSLDDSGVKATGRYNTSATFAYDDALGINDLLSLTAGSGTLIEGLGQSSRNASLAYSIPYGYWTFSSYLSAYDYRQIIQGAFQKFVRSGNTQSTELRAERVIHRNQSSRTSLDLRLVKRQSKQFIDDVELEVQRRNTTSIQMGASHRHYLGAAIVEGTLAVRQGGPWLGADADAPDLPAGSPTTQYTMKILDASVGIPFKIGSLPLQYRFNTHAQQTDDLVLGTEFFSIGSRNTVRGFDNEHNLAAENGWYVRNELGVQLPQSWPEIYLALDAGHVSGPSTALLAGNQLAGCAVGARKMLGGVYFDFFVGKPIRQPRGFGADKTTAGFQLSASF